MKDDILNISNLHNLVDYNGRKLFGAEKLLENVLPEWIIKAGSVSLKNVLHQYLDLIKHNIENLKIFINNEGVGKLSRANDIMQAFIVDIREQLSNCTDIEIIDACLLSCIQSINHYKIYMYGTAATYAKALDSQETAAIFHQAKLNEEEIDHSLTQLAKTEINIRARNKTLLSNNND